MKIALLSDSVTIPTGYSNQMRQIARHLKSQGHEIMFLANGYMGSDIEKLTLKGGEEFDYPIYGHDQTDQYFNKTMSHRLKEFKADRFIILLDTFMLYPWFLNIDTSPAKTFFYFPSDGGGGMPKGCEQILKKVDQSISMAEFGAKQVKDYYGLDVKHIPHCVDSKQFYPLEDSEKLELKKKYGLADKFVIGVVARNQPRKNLDRTIKAMRLIADKVPNAILFLHLDPNDPAQQMWKIGELVKKNNLENRVVYSGMNAVNGFPQSKMNEVYNLMDCFLLTTSGEGFGIPIIEAMACFPYDTKITSPTDITKGHIRDYDGEMFEICLDGKNIKCTPEHPIFTDRGWIKAKDLNTTDTVYLRSTNNEKVDGRRIGEIAEKLFSYNKEGFTAVIPGQDVSVINTESRYGEMGSVSEKRQKQIHKHGSSKDDGNRDSVSCRYDRCGRDNNTSEKLESNNIKTKVTSVKHRYKDNGLVDVKNSRRNSKQEKETAKTQEIVSVEARGSENIRNIKEITTTSYHKDKSLWNFDFFCGEKIGEENRRQIFERRLRMLREDKSIKSQRVKGLKRFQYTGKVYNVSTESGIYFADGLLVHNCQVPVVATDYTTTPELVINNHAGLGIKLSGVEKLDMFNLSSQEYDKKAFNATMTGSWEVERGFCDIENCAEAVEMLSKNPAMCKEMGENGRKAVLTKYDNPIVMKQWDAVLV